MSTMNERANLIWNIANDSLRDVYKRHQYGSVILPMIVLKRFDDVLAKTKNEVYETYKKVKDMNDYDLILMKKSGYTFFNKSQYNFKRLLNDPDNIESNFNDYINGFSENVLDIMSNYEINKHIEKLAKNKILYSVIDAVQKIDLHPDNVSNIDMGYVFEEVIRRFSEAQNEEAGEHYTPREVIELMVTILFEDEDLSNTEETTTKTIYDPACGTGGMLTVSEEHLKKLNSNYNLISYGQEIQDETYAICKSDILIKGKDANHIKHGNTLTNDLLGDYKFDYIISNPPFGKSWKNDKTSVEREHKLGFGGRFGIGLPKISDGQMLFLQATVAKMKDPDKGGSRVAIIHNGSPLFTGDAGSGPSEIRKYLIENDLLEAIIALPNDIFYNTGIPTYIWILSNKKETKRKGKIQLIDANNFYIKMRKSLGKKNKELSSDQIKVITQMYCNFKEEFLELDGKTVESKIFEGVEFGYSNVTIEKPLKDENGDLILKKGKRQKNKEFKDSENIPLKVDIENYFKKEVLPLYDDAYINYDKITTGYKIPFTKYFFKYESLDNIDTIINDIKKIDEEERFLMKELFEND